MARKMDQTEERQIPRVMAVAIGNGVDHHYEIHDMHLNRVWLEKIRLYDKTPFKVAPKEALSLAFWESCAEDDINNPAYWMPRA